MSSPHLRGRELVSTSLRLGSIYINYVEFFCPRDLPLLHKLLFYPVIYLYQHGFMDTYLIFRVIIQYDFNLLFKFFKFWPFFSS